MTTQMGSFSTDGSTRMGSTTTGIGPFSTSVMSGRMQERGFQMRKKGSVTMMILVIIRFWDELSWSVNH